jgi:hypothetical protein
MKDEKVNKAEVPEQSDEIEEIIYEEELPWSEVLQCVFAAFSSIEDIDMELASPMDRQRIRRIKRKGLRLIDAGINEIYAEKFESDDTDEKQL